MSGIASLTTLQRGNQRSDSIVGVSTSVVKVLKVFMNRLLVSADDYMFLSTDECGYISGLCLIMNNHIETNNKIIERERAMSAEFPTSIEQQQQASTIAEELKVEIDAARLLNLESIPMSHETLAALSQLLLGLRQRIQDQDREITQLRDRMSGPIGNQQQGPILYKSNDRWVL
jgi:hypothetical protein